MTAENAAQERTAYTIALALTPNANTDQLTECVAQAEGLFKAECARNDVPEAAMPVIARMARTLYARVDGEGLAAQSYSGQSETFLSDWPADLRRAIHRFRKLVTL